MPVLNLEILELVLTVGTMVIFWPYSQEAIDGNDSYEGV